MNGRNNEMNCLAIMQNGNIVSGSEDRTIKIFDKDTFVCVRTINGHNRDVLCLAIMQNGNIVSGSEDEKIKIWDKDTFECIMTIKGHTNYVKSLAIPQNGNIVSGSWDKTIKIWDINTFECLKTIDGHIYAVNCLAIMQNGNIVSGSRDRGIKLWHKDTFKCIKTINGHTNHVNTLAILQNGNIVSGSLDETIKIWDKDTFECLKTLNCHNHQINCLAIMLDGNINPDNLLQLLVKNKCRIYAFIRFLLVKLKKRASSVLGGACGIGKAVVNIVTELRDLIRLTIRFYLILERKKIKLENKENLNNFDFISCTFLNFDHGTWESFCCSFRNSPKPELPFLIGFIFFLDINIIVVKRIYAMMHKIIQCQGRYNNYLNVKNSYECDLDTWIAVPAKRLNITLQDRRSKVIFQPGLGKIFSKSSHLTLDFLC
ncbi:hypothetical protein BpHYR1_033051 [Brachionus plicatilis]|uniref:Uncharacterized protein n=1 Tax=Brachionus plicatilis TaxID=10195 RepID=A0A3M7PY61_BRAPC|nr:hypothetical protein BpHYR1_033051 [Brachionus plicatilis]